MNRLRPRARTLILAILAVSLAGVRGDAQSAPDPRLRERLDARTAASVQGAVDAARVDGLPTEPLVLKALEGASKGAEGARILAAVARLRTQLGVARAALGGTSSEAEVVAATDALQAGVAEEALVALREARPSAPLTTALAVLSDLIGRGVPVPAATETVLSLVRAGTPDSQLAVFRQEVQSAIRGGTLPAAAAAAARGGRPAGIPASPGKSPPGKAGGRPPSE